MIKTVVREHHWSKSELDNYYLDDMGYDGLEFWYEDVLQTIKEIKEAQKKKPGK